ncbi:MAG: hypothetical protein WBG38_07695 [Nodosilinea sp.]
MTLSSRTLSDLSDRDPALAVLAAFEQSTHPGAWPHLDKADMVQEMRSHLGDSYIVNQGPQPFCGPASVLLCRASGRRASLAKVLLMLL